MEQSLAIETKGLIHTYQKHFWSKKTSALRGLDLDVAEGEIYGYLGANGAGKTTTIKVLVGLQRQTAGDARICGIPVNDPKSRQSLGFQPENPYFYEYLTAMESMLFYAALCDVPAKERKSRSEELLEFVSMKEAANVRVGEFSKGMRQRLGIAQALVHRPKVVILDEPMSGLDPVGRSQVREAILNLKEQGLTVFFSSHVLSDVEMISDRVGLLQDGKLEACGPIHDLLDAQSKSFELGVENVDETTAENLSKKASRVMDRKGTRTYVFSSRDDADDAVAAVIQSGGRISSLRPHRESLEEYFMRTSGKARDEVGAWSGGADR